MHRGKGKKRYWKNMHQNANSSISGQSLSFPLLCIIHIFHNEKVTIRPSSEQHQFQSRKHHAELYPHTTWTVAAAVVQVLPGSEYLYGRQHWHVAALPGPPDAQPRLRTEARTASQSHGCTETQKTGDGHCCTQPTETQSKQTQEWKNRWSRSGLDQPKASGCTV